MNIEQSLKTAIQEALLALFQVEAHRIKIVKMKSYKLLSAPNVKINVGGNNDSTNKTNILNVEIVDAKDTFRKTINTDNVEEVIDRWLIY